MSGIILGSIIGFILGVFVGAAVGADWRCMIMKKMIFILFLLFKPQKSRNLELNKNKLQKRKFWSLN